jgi:hypothetical protein
MVIACIFSLHYSSCVECFCFGRKSNHWSLVFAGVVLNNCFVVLIFLLSCLATAAVRLFVAVGVYIY